MCCDEPLILQHRIKGCAERSRLMMNEPLDTHDAFGLDTITHLNNIYGIYLLLSRLQFIEML